MQWRSVRSVRAFNTSFVPCRSIPTTRGSHTAPHSTLLVNSVCKPSSSVRASPSYQLVLTLALSLHADETDAWRAPTTADLLDEKPLIPSQIKQFAELLLGCSNLPEPEVDRKGFAEAVKNALAEVPLTYDPRTKSMKPWINVKHIFGGSGGCVVC
mgnify:CR=1 FL=1